MHIDTLICARWIIPVEPHGLVMQNQAVAVANGNIVEILPIDKAQQKYQADAVAHMEHHALIPGLINSHTHAAMSFLRGIADDQPLMEWLQGTIWPIEQKWVGESFVSDATELAIAEMLRGGITCFNDMYFFPEITARIALNTGIRAKIGLIQIEFPSAWAQSSDEYLTKGLALHDELRNEQLVTAAFAPHAPYSVSNETLEKVRMYSEELELPVHMHVHETADEISQSLDQFGTRPLSRLHQLGIIGPSFIAVHMTQLTEAEIEMVAECGSSIVHCPESNLKLASGFCPVAKLIQAGINVALGTDSAASNNDLDILGEMRTAALLAKGVAEDASAVPAATALRMATLNGAKALGLESAIGSLKPKKSADITAIRLDTLETQPIFDPISQIVYAANRDQITDVWVAGRHLLKSRELTSLNIDQIKANVTLWADKLSSPH